MADKVVKLSVHKNTMEKRRRREMRAAFLQAAKLLSEPEAGIAGYAIIVVDKGQGDGTVLHAGDLRPAEFQLIAERALREMFSAGGEIPLSEEEDDKGA